ncbi:hypothetical protein [Nocardia sp. NPDC051463]|uniref:hypothetical protein n=1 Tax=Nocardia sp. NPDC051463 TaxID=3154845 RepID=UPI00343BF830
MRLLGTATGGTPGNPQLQARYATMQQPGLTGISNFPMWLGLAGLSRECPEVFDAKKMLTVKGQSILQDVQRRCYTIALTGMYRLIGD